MRSFLLSILLIIALHVLAQTSGGGAPTEMSPYYFGPNAFAVPDMLDGTVRGKIRVELTNNNFVGYEKDKTHDATVKLNFPLFTSRANISMWMPIIEWYHNSDERLKTINLWNEAGENSRIRKGQQMGDLYVSADIHVIKERRILPDIALRATLRTSLGGNVTAARFYKSPGYFFDATVGKSFGLPTVRKISLRVAATLGYLCWQSNDARQDNAKLYGAMAALRLGKWEIVETLRGYKGNGFKFDEAIKDRPMVLKTQVVYHLKSFELLGSYQAGLQHYPFHQFQLGMALNINVQKEKK